MQVTVSTESPLDFDADALVIIAYEDGLKETAAQIDSKLNGTIARLIADGELSTKVGRTFALHSPVGLRAKLLIVTGGGLSASAGPSEVTRMIGSATKRLADRARPTVALALDLPKALQAVAICGAMNGAVGQDLFRADKNLKSPDRLVFLRSSSSTDPDTEIERGRILGSSTLLARELVNLPPNLMSTTAFADRAVAECGQRNIQVEVWDELRLRRERCGSLLAVASGSQMPPRLLIMRYAGKGAGQPVALVGKGVTFDSGGLSIKPTDGMLAMKCDMAGAATVVATLCAAADLGLDQPIVGLVGLVENMISGSAMRLGDVLTARSGTTIEVQNTDAEGRLVLADVLNVTLDQNPQCIIDLATLTGACVVALGTDIAGLMTNDAALQQSFQEAASRAGELVWPLPMHRYFDEQITSQVADIKNVGDGRWGGAITAAKFLERFVDGRPWLHIDIAGPAFADKPKSHHDAGGTGTMLRSLIEFLATRSSS